MVEMAEALSSEQTQRSLWLGDLPHWVDESHLFNIFVVTGQLVSVKLIRNRSWGSPRAMRSWSSGRTKVRPTYSPTGMDSPFPTTPTQVFRLNWAAYGVGKATPSGEVCTPGPARPRHASSGAQTLLSPFTCPRHPPPQTTPCLWGTWPRTYWPSSSRVL